MKPCEEYVEKILLSLDGELSQAEEQALQAHLAACPGCKCLYETYRHIDLGIQEGEEEPPEGLSRAVMSAIRQEKKTPLSLLKRGKFTLIAAAAAIVILIAGRSLPISLDTGRSASDSAAADAAIEQEAAAEAGTGEFLPAPQNQAEGEVAEATEAAPAEAPQLEADVDAAPTELPQAEEAEEAPEAPESGALPEMDYACSGTSADSLQAVWTLLEQEGYTGSLHGVCLTEEALYGMLPDCQKRVLGGQTVVYETTRADYEAVADQIQETASAGTDSESDQVFLYLNP